jgi:Rod binding protein.
MKIEGLSGYQINNILTAKQTYDDESFETALRKAYDEGDREKLKEVCAQFEAIMLKTLYKQMKATIPKGGLFEESNAREIFEDMLDDELMQQCSKRGVGIADMIYKQLSARMDRTYTTSGSTAQSGGEEVQSENGAEEVDKAVD